MLKGQIPSELCQQESCKIWKICAYHVERSILCHFCDLVNDHVRDRAIFPAENSSSTSSPEKRTQSHDKALHCTQMEPSQFFAIKRGVTHGACRAQKSSDEWWIKSIRVEEDSLHVKLTWTNTGLRHQQRRSVNTVFVVELVNAHSSGSDSNIINIEHHILSLNSDSWQITSPQVVHTTFNPRMEELKGRNEYVKATNKDGVAILEGTATWCSQCKAIAPFVDQVYSADHPGTVAMKAD